MFLETTIQADRVLGSEKRQKIVLANLDGKALVSSTTVLGEFIDTFVHDAVLFYNLVVDSPSIPVALKRLTSYRDRLTKRCITIFASIVEEWGYVKEEVLDRLELWIDWGLTYRFRQGLILLVEGTDCAKTRASPTKENNRYIIPIPGLACTQESPPKCSVEAFIAAYKGDLIDIIGKLCDLEQKDDSQKKMIAVGSRVANGQEKPIGRACQCLKDIIIALEAPGGSAIYTTNIKHFEPICAAIGKQLYKEKRSDSDN